MPLIEPVESREVKKIQEFVIVVDTSYSTNGELIHNFLKETYTILTEQNSFFAKSRIHIIQCDDQVRMDEEVKTAANSNSFLNRFTVIGGGGTDFRPAFAYVNELLEQGVLKKILAGCYILRMARAFIRRNGRNIRPHFCFWMIMMRVPFHRGQ